MTDNERYSISTYIAPLSSVIKSDPAETLGTVLSLVDSSHTAIYVFSKNGHLIGLLSPYNSLYQHRYPYTTKIASILLTPPRITTDTPLYEVAKHMLATRIYVLPIFEDEHISGVIHGEKVIKEISTDRDLLFYMSQTIKTHAPITASIHATVGDVYHIMRDKHVSRVILVNDEGTLEGIVARKDLMHAFIKPTPKQRFSKKSGDSGYFAFDEEKEYRKNDPIRKYFRPRVETAFDHEPKEVILQKLIDSKNNSIVLIDKNKRPMGFLSMRDIIQSVASLEPEETIQLIMNKPSKNVPREDMERAEEHLLTFGKKMQKRIAIEKMEITIDEPKYANGHTASYDITIIITPVAGEKIIAKTQQQNFLNGLHAATEQLQKQERRHAKTHTESQFAGL